MPTPAKLLQTAQTHHQAGRLQDAEKAYRALLGAVASHAEALRLLGALYLQTRQWDLAVDCLEKAAHLLSSDAETLTNFGTALLHAGKRDAAVLWYEKALALKPDYLPALGNLGHLYHEAGRAAEAVAIHEHITRLKPDDAPTHFAYANSLLSTGKNDEAIAHYEQALRLHPDYIEAMINLGMILSHAGKGEAGRRWLEAARLRYGKILQADPSNAAAMNNLANILRQLGRAEEAVAHFREALRVRPDYAEAATNLATSLRDLNRLDEAIESSRLALRLKPDSFHARVNLGVFLQDKRRHEEAITLFAEALQRKPASPDAKWNKALSHLALGQYREGWALHEVGLGVAHMRGKNFAPQRRWTGEEIAGKRLLLWCEQGFGDSMQFIRYAALCKARGAHVSVHCPQALRRLFANDAFIDALPESLEAAAFDFHAPLMSLPYIFGSDLDTIPVPIPYLHISEQTRAKWAKIFTDQSDGIPSPPSRGERVRVRGDAGNTNVNSPHPNPTSENTKKLTSRPEFKVGLAWAGNPRENHINAHLADRRRSISLEMLRPLFDVAGTKFYNLQMPAAAAQIDACRLRGRIVDYMGDVKDFEDTGAIIERLDLIISVDTSIVHLAGGLGRPVWVLSRFDACWRWLQNRPDNPWYPTARVFGQETPGDWQSVVESVKATLKAVKNK
ncbi:MAG: tetratricopeptide repeat protein [Alphaproteobacteria bacterium]|nr:tetratricopeptide repeat protein [Alphaproteobacteria bacterium]